MLSDLKNFSTPEYFIQDDQIGYKDHDSISFNISYGYKTLFAYYHEHQQDASKISQGSLDSRIGLIINCGIFSYADIPSRFSHIIGVSGTLDTLHDPEQQVIQDDFKIEIFTYMPSVFGKRNLNFASNKDVKVHREEDYLNEIRKEINSSIIGKNGEKSRVILVFFESQKKLEEFLNSPAMSDIRNDVNIMTEELSDREKIIAVKKATISGQITLSTKAFGRGCDFICKDPIVIANGGVHSIQTFLSAELAEETQIKGRAARQGQDGSFSMVLLDSDLELFSITKDEIDEMSRNGNYYSILNTRRRDFFVLQYANDTTFVQAVKNEHTTTMSFIGHLDTGDVAQVKKYLLEKNKGPTGVSKSKTIILMDATVSMSALLQSAKNTVGDMFNRATDVLSEHGIAQDVFQVQFVVYRNYNSSPSNILQVSPWESQPENLGKFMKNIHVNGGWGNEAIEIGLWHVNKEIENGTDVSQVILIGDAPANTKSEVEEKRNSRQYSVTDWSKTKFSQPTYWEDELALIKAKSIPVHSFYVARNAKDNFSKIAELTGGNSDELNVNQASGAARLTDVVTKTILQNVGGEKGDALVQSYERKFPKTYN